MTDDSRFATNAARNENRRELIDTLQAIFLTQSYKAWEALFLANGSPVGTINTIDQVVEHSQLQVRGMRVESEHPVAGMVKLVGPAVKLSDTPDRVRSPAPALGQHTDAVLREMLDMDTAAIEALREAGAIGPKRS